MNYETAETIGTIIGYGLSLLLIIALSYLYYKGYKKRKWEKEESWKNPNLWRSS